MIQDFNFMRILRTTIREQETYLGKIFAENERDEAQRTK